MTNKEETMQIKFHMPPEARGRDPESCTPYLQFLTKKEKQAVRILERVGDDRLLAVVCLHDADSSHQEKWAEVQIKVYSEHSVQYLILYKRSLFKKKDDKIRTQEEWLKLLTQCKKKVAGEATKPDFVQLDGEDLPREMKSFYVSTKEGQQIMLDKLRKVASKMRITHVKLQALISI